jgi:hypothetical protein
VGHPSTKGMDGLHAGCMRASCCHLKHGRYLGRETDPGRKDCTEMDWHFRKIILVASRKDRNTDCTRKGSGQHGLYSPRLSTCAFDSLNIAKTKGGKRERRCRHRLGQARGGVNIPGQGRMEPGAGKPVIDQPALALPDQGGSATASIADRHAYLAPVHAGPGTPFEAVVKNLDLKKTQDQ